MPLSEHEKRMLSEIEHALTTENPRLASRLRSARPRLVTNHRVGWIRVAQAIVSLLLILIGLQVAGGPGVVMSVLGYLLLVTFLTRAATARHRPHDEP